MGELPRLRLGVWGGGSPPGVEACLEPARCRPEYLGRMCREAEANAAYLALVVDLALRQNVVQAVHDQLLQCFAGVRLLRCHQGSKVPDEYFDDFDLKFGDLLTFDWLLTKWGVRPL